MMIGRPRTGAGVKGASVPFKLVPVFNLTKYAAKQKDDALFREMEQALTEIAQRHNLDVAMFLSNKEGA
jgi:hypothetical protein